MNRGCSSGSPCTGVEQKLPFGELNALGDRFVTRTWPASGFFTELDEAERVPLGRERQGCGLRFQNVRRCSQKTGKHGVPPYAAEPIRRIARIRLLPMDDS